MIEDEKRFNPPTKATKFDVIMMVLVLGVFPLIYFPLGLLWGIFGILN